MPRLEIDSIQRKTLRGLAHGLKPLVSIGRQGLSEGAVAEVDHALESHELIKVRLGEGSEMSKSEKRAMLADLSDRVGCAVAGIVGHVGILYRPASDPEERRIRV